MSGTPPTATDCAPLHTVHPFWMESAPVSSKDDDLQRKRRWRAGTGDIRRLREIAKKFEGTRNFHNFTVGREFSDRSTQRHMKKIEVSLFSQGLQGLITHTTGCGPSCLWQHGVDQRHVSWPEFHASPGTQSLRTVVSLLTLLLDRACVEQKPSLPHSWHFAPQRKMVSALVLCCRTCTPPQVIEEVRYTASFYASS